MRVVEWKHKDYKGAIFSEMFFSFKIPIFFLDFGRPLSARRHCDISKIEQGEFQFLKLKRGRWGVTSWLSRLRIPCWHCCGSGYSCGAGFDSWLRSFCMLWLYPPIKRSKKRKKENGNKNQATVFTEPFHSSLFSLHCHINRPKLKDQSSSRFQLSHNNWLFAHINFTRVQILLRAADFQGAETSSAG